MVLEYAKFFIFASFSFSTLDDFREKTYEKTYCFYNIFSKCISNHARLPSFTIWIFFSKILWSFQYKIIFFKFHDLCEKTYQKTYKFYELFPNFLSLCARWQDFVIWKYLLKKWRLLQYVNNFLLSSATLSIIFEQTYEKTYPFFSIF